MKMNQLIANVFYSSLKRKRLRKKTFSLKMQMMAMVQKVLKMSIWTSRVIF
jgi:hypothetical protein